MAVGINQQSAMQNSSEAIDTPLLQQQEEKRAADPVARSTKPGHCVVRLLDGTIFETNLQKNANGQQLVKAVCDFLMLEERDYFSCSYLDDKKVRFWLIHDKPISSQVKKTGWNFSFEVKFYPIDPDKLQQESTRYQLCLQVRTDILNGKLPCSYVTHQLLGSYIVQSEFGDYNPDEHGQTIDYIKQVKFVQGQSEDLLEKISRLHETNRGMTPAEAELCYLENAKILAFYGVDMHRATVRNRQPLVDEEATTKQQQRQQPLLEGEVFVGVSAHGLTVYKDRLVVFRWPWQKILHFSYTLNGFKVIVRPKVQRNKPVTYKYKLTYEMAKRLWRAAVEHHAFFRLSKPVDPERAPFPKLGQKFRYSGRTQQQVTGEPNLDGHEVPFINRGANPRFMTLGRSGILDTSTGYSTDRGEKYHIDTSRSNTLDLKDRKKRNISALSDSMDATSPVPMAGFEDDRNLVAVDNDHVQMNSDGSMLYSRASAPYPTSGYFDNSQPGDRSFQPGDEFNRSSVNSSKYPGYDVPETTIKQTTVNVFMTADNRASGPQGDEESLPPYQDDILRHHDKSRPGGVRASWDTSNASSSWGPSASRETKTSSRTYTDSDGNIITEFVTERENIIERRVERRTVLNEDDEVDHDKALLEAIRAVTDMNPDLSVEKIEIQTTTEQQQQQQQHPQ